MLGMWNCIRLHLMEQQSPITLFAISNKRHESHRTSLPCSDLDEEAMEKLVSSEQLNDLVVIKSIKVDKDKKYALALRDDK